MAAVTPADRMRSPSPHLLRGMAYLVRYISR